MNKKDFLFTISIIEDSKGVKVCDDGKNFFSFFASLTKEEKDLIDAYFDKIKNEKINKIDDSEIIRILSKFGQGKIGPYKDKEEILYQDLEDENDCKYGKEVLTNAIFPIADEVLGFDVEEKETFNNAFYNSNDTRKIYYFKGHDSNLDVLFIDTNGKRISGNIYSTDHDIYDLRNTSDRLFRTSIMRYKIYMKRVYNHDNMNRLEVTLIPDGYANQKEVSDYEDKSIFGSIRKRNKIKTINNLHDLNNIKDESIISYTTKKNSKNVKMINYIEATIAMLRDINIDLYNEYNNRYQSILKEESMIEVNKRKELEDFYYDLVKLISIDDNFNKTISYLNGYVNKLFDDIINNRHINISLAYLTELHDDFLGYEKTYTMWEVQQINTKLNILYFLYLYAHKNDDSTEAIHSSYIKSNIKGILNVIQSLLNLNVIEYDSYLSMHSDAFFEIHPISIYELLSLISTIKFKDAEKGKELIKA